MLGINYWAVVVATAAAFVFSSLWYIVFGKARMKLLGNDPEAMTDMRKVPAGKMLFEGVRCRPCDRTFTCACRDRRLDGRGAARTLDGDLSGYDPCRLCFVG